MTVTKISDAPSKRITIPVLVLGKFSDSRLRARHNLIRIIEQGGPSSAELTDTRNEIVRSAFPLGYNPQEHPEDNLQALEDEAKRRGVTLSST